jgi:hypothetical protein
LWELALQAAHSLAGECRSGLQTARRCCLLDALHPASVPDADSIPVQSQPNKQKRHRKGVVNAGIGHPGQPPRLHARCRSQARSSAARIPCCLAGRAFACKQMPLRASNSTQVLFVYRPPPPRPYRTRPQFPQHRYQNKKPTTRVSFGKWELAILASHRACMRVVVRRLAAVLLEFPAHPASVPDAAPISAASLSKQKAHPQGVSFLFCWWRRRELNPRPQALYRQFYILSQAV